MYAMKHLRFIFQAVFFRYAPLFLIITSAGFAQDIRFDTMIRDLGEMKQRESQNVTFTVYNRGLDTVRLGPVNAGCGCTQVALKSTTLAPQDSTILSVTFSTGPHMLGEITKRISVGQSIGSRELPPQELRIRAEVVGEVIFSPKRISFRTTVGSTVKTKVTLRSNSPERVRITEITPVLTAFIDTSRGNTYRAGNVISEPFEALNITPSSRTITPRSSEELDLVIVPTRKGQISGFIRITFPSSEIRIPVTGVILPSE